MRVRRSAETATDARTAVADVAFGFGIFNADGVRCYGTNTRIEGMSPGGLVGEGVATCVLDRLDLVAGTYTLDLTVLAADGTPCAHDHHCTFTVTSTVKDVGVFRPPHRWLFSGGISMAAPHGTTADRRLVP